MPTSIQAAIFDDTETHTPPNPGILLCLHHCMVRTDGEAIRTEVCQAWLYFTLCTWVREYRKYLISTDLADSTDYNGVCLPLVAKPFPDAELRDPLLT